MSRRKGGGPLACFSFWYCDDGQVVCRPADVDLFLECLGRAAATVGATRGEGEDVKSTVRLIGHPDALAAFGDEWVTPRIQRTCKVAAPNSCSEVLGAVSGDREAAEAMFSERTERLRELHVALREVDDPAVEMTLGRLCADVCRSVHLLRAAGHQVGMDALDAHDCQLGRFVEHTLGGDLPDRALDQAALGVTDGGLGFRRAAGLALPAFVASRIEVRPFVERLFASMAAAGVFVPGAMERYDAQTRDALQSFTVRLAPARAQLAESFCEQAAVSATESLARVLRGDPFVPQGPPVPTAHVGDRILGELGDDDPEHPASACSRRPRLQRQLAVLWDKQRLQELSSDNDADTRRLADLADPTVSAEWLWALSPVQPHRLESDACVAAVRLRFGASFAQ